MVQRKDILIAGIVLSTILYLLTLIYFTDCDEPCVKCGFIKYNNNLKWHHIATYLLVWFLVVYCLSDKRKRLEIYVLCVVKGLAGALLFNQFGMPKDWRWIEFLGMALSVTEALYEVRKKLKSAIQ